MFGKIKKIGTSTAIFFALFLPVDSSVWESSKKDYTNRNYDPTITELQESGIVNWDKKFTSPSNWSGPEAVYKNDIIYVVGGAGTSGGSRTVYALEKDTGNEIWQKNFTTVYGYQLLIGGDDCLILLSKTEIYFLDLNSGTEIFRISDYGNFSFFNAVWYGDGIYVYGTANATQKSSYFYKISFSGQKILWKIENTLANGQIDYPIPYSEDEVILSQQETRPGKVSLIQLNLIKVAPGACPTGFCREIVAESTVDADTGGSVDSLVLLNNSLLARKTGPGMIQFWRINITATGQKTLETLTKHSARMTSMVAANNDTLAILEKVAESDTQVYFHKFHIDDDSIEDSGRTLLEGVNVDDYMLYQIRPIISDNHFFVLKNDVKGYYEGKTQYRYFVYAINLENSEVKSYPFYYLDGSYYPRDMIHIGGTFLLRLKYNAFQAITIADMKFSETIVTSPYKTGDGYQQYLGQIHAHHIEDIKVKDYSAYDVVKRYKDAGYDFIAMTEHNQLTPDPKVPGITYINMAEEDTQEHGGNHILGLGISSTIDESRSDQERINAVVNQGGFASLAHPSSAFYPWPLNKLVAADSFQGIEGFNSSMDEGGKLFDFAYESGALDNSYSFIKIDQLLTRGKRIFITAGDDYTPNNPGFDGGAIVVWAKSSNQNDILQGLKNGNFYALKGSEAPKFQSIIVNKNKISVQINQKEDIYFLGSGGQYLKIIKNSSTADYLFNGNEGYVRIQIGAKNGKTWSQPIYIDRQEEATKDGEGLKRIELDQNYVLAATTDLLKFKTLERKYYPDKGPKGGYLSPVYDLSTQGSLSGKAELSLKIPDTLQKSLYKKLSLFTYNESTGNWESVSSFVNVSDKSITGSLSHFSLYVLSYEISEDNIAPQIIFKEKTDNYCRFAVNENESSLISVNAVAKGIGELSLDQEGDNYILQIPEVLNSESNFYILAEDEFGNVGREVYTISRGNLPPTASGDYEVLTDEERLPLNDYQSISSEPNHLYRAHNTISSTDIPQTTPLFDRSLNTDSNQELKIKVPKSDSDIRSIEPGGLLKGERIGKIISNKSVTLLFLLISMIVLCCIKKTFIKRKGG